MSHLRFCKANGQTRINFKWIQNGGYAGRTQEQNDGGAHFKVYCIYATKAEALKVYLKPKHTSATSLACDILGQASLWSIRKYMLQECQKCKSLPVSVSMSSLPKVQAATTHISWKRSYLTLYFIKRSKVPHPGKILIRFLAVQKLMDWL